VTAAERPIFLEKNTPLPPPLASLGDTEPTHTEDVSGRDYVEGVPQILRMTGVNPPASRLASPTRLAVPGPTQSATTLPEPRAGRLQAAAAPTAPRVPEQRFDEMTTVEDPSADLLRKSVPPGLLAPPLPGAVPGFDEDPLDVEFRLVFQEFLETKQRCGESIDGVTFDRFSVKLKSKRDELMSGHSCKSVKFQVYIKDGKAALKATPVGG
jgi:hypothetical protein